MRVGALYFWKFLREVVDLVGRFAPDYSPPLPRPLEHDAHVLPQRSPQALSRAFGYLVKRLGLKDLRLHELRHDVASTLTMAGVSQRAVMAMLGHRDPRHERPSSGTISAPAG